MPDRPALRRCAIYTRKSSDEGLDQAFNSLDAQRDACTAWVRITAQLIDAKTGNHLWSEPTEIAEQVTNRLGGGVSISTMMNDAAEMGYP